MSDASCSQDHILTTTEELEALYGEPLGRSLIKEIDHISDHYRAFVEASPFLIIASIGPEGLDCSPRGDPAGFVRVADPRIELGDYERDIVVLVIFYVLGKQCLEFFQAAEIVESP